jgi:CheY-like chemotaxis protein
MREHIHILLVEDDPDDVELLRVAFEESKILFELAVITQGHKVIPHLNELVVLPDIIVLDLNLPKIHGCDLLAEIKTMEQFNSLPVIILTTSSAKKDIDFCMEKGADKFLVKPVTMADYSKIVATIVEASRKASSTDSSSI